MNIRTSYLDDWQKGFSLVEIAIVLVIVGVILASVSGPLSTYKANERYQQTERYLEQVRQALLTFGAVKGYLPCPDSDATPDGLQNDGGSSKACDKREGWLPYLDLGLDAETPWGAVPKYFVHDRADNEVCADSSSPSCFYVPPAVGETSKFAFSTPAGTGPENLKVDDEVTTGSDYIVSQGLALVISYGANTAETLADCSAGSGGALEEENCNGDYTFLHTSYRNSDTNSYDDQMIWLDKLAVHGLLIGN